MGVLGMRPNREVLQQQVHKLTRKVIQLERTVARLEKMALKSQTAMARGVLRRTNANTKAQSTQVEVFEGELYNDVELWEQYGLTSIPADGDELLVLSPGGGRDKAVGLTAQKRSSRPKGGLAGDVTLYHEAGHKVYLQSGGSISIIPHGVGLVNIGALVADLFAARVTDPVAPNPAMATWMTQVTTNLNTIGALFNLPPAPVNSLGPGSIPTIAAPPTPTFATIFSGSTKVKIQT
jgi:phage baseplate assembly protein V